MLVLSRKNEESVVLLVSRRAIEAALTNPEDTLFRRIHSSNSNLVLCDAEGNPLDCLAIEVTVVDIRGDKTRIGITADERVIAHRSEVLDKIIDTAQQSRVA